MKVVQLNGQTQKLFLNYLEPPNSSLGPKKSKQDPNIKSRVGCYVPPQKKDPKIKSQSKVKIEKKNIENYEKVKQFD